MFWAWFQLRPRLGLECRNNILTRDIHHEKLPEITRPNVYSRLLGFMSKFHFDTPMGQIGSKPPFLPYSSRMSFHIVSAAIIATLPAFISFTLERTSSRKYASLESHSSNGSSRLEIIQYANAALSLVDNRNTPFLISAMLIIYPFKNPCETMIFSTPVSKSARNF